MLNNYSCTQEEDKKMRKIALNEECANCERIEIRKNHLCTTQCEIYKALHDKKQ